jgi:hypothetical protein
MSKDNGGPAFPVAEQYDERGGTYTQYGSEGMTLRDYFAAKAMQAMLSNPTMRSTDNSISDAEAFANASYIMADGLLAERAK